MIDINNAKNSFMKYVSDYDDTNPNINRKIYHSLRVMELSTQIAKSLNLSNEEIEIATLIGLLHDIARFYQFTKYHTFKDRLSIDHGDYGVKILEENNYIREFIKTDEYDYIIKKAIKNHNKYKIEDGLDDKTLMFCKIIRDADKLDILYEGTEIFWSTDEEKREVENTEISDEYFDKIIKCESIEKNGTTHSKIDTVIFLMTLIYDINYKYSFEYIINQNLVDGILYRFNYKENIKIKIDAIKNAVMQFIKNKIA